MRGVVLVAALSAPVAAGALLLRPGDGETALAEDAPAAAPAALPEGLRTLRGTSRAPAAARAEPERPPDPAEADWLAALAAHEAGRHRDALALARRARKTSPAWFADPARAAKWKEIAAAAKAAEDALAVLRLSALERASADPGEDRRLTREEREALDRVLARAAEIIAEAQTPEERAALLRHARRFLIEPSHSRGDALARRLARLSRGRRSSDADEPLPQDDDEAVEARRVEQLERLRQRDLVSLLDRIHAGLAWLALHQHDDGRFSDSATRARCKKLEHAACAPAESDQLAVATTALALCAFLDFRDQDALGLFEPTLSRGIAWLLSKQAPDGSFPGAGATYTSAIGLMAIAQASGSTGREDLRAATSRGLAWFASVQHRDGGFRYAPRQAGDLSATGWVAQAVAAARHAGIAPPPGLEEGIDRFLRSVWRGDQEFGYTDGTRDRPSLAPVGMLTAQLVWKDVAPATHAAWRAHLAEPVRRRNLYWLYYAVRVALALDGGLNPALRDVSLRLAAAQSNKGDAAGSFPGKLDPWLQRGGTTLQTAVAVLTLEHALFLR
jgi:hypothetical protein